MLVVKEINIVEKRCGFLWLKKKTVRECLIKNTSSQDAKKTFNIEAYVENGIDADLIKYSRTYVFYNNSAVKIELEDKHTLFTGEKVSFDFLVDNYAQYFTFKIKEL